MELSGPAGRATKRNFPSPGDRAPSFDLPALVSLEHGGELQRISHNSFPGRWLVLLYWPLDFSPLCPGPIARMGESLQGVARDVQVLGISSHAAEHLLELRSCLANLPFPILSDCEGELRAALRIPPDEPFLRLTCNVDPAGFVRWVGVEDLSPSRSLREAIRAVDAVGGVIQGAPPVANRNLVCMCAWCGRVRDPGGRWLSIDTFVRERMSDLFTHGICPTCFEEQAV